MRTVIGLFDDRTEAMNAYNALQSAGFTKSELDILTSDDLENKAKLAAVRAT